MHFQWDFCPQLLVQPVIGVLQATFIDDGNYLRQ